MNIEKLFPNKLEDYTVSELKALSCDLTPEEERSPYAKYYHLGPAAIPAAQRRILDNGKQIPIEQVIMPEEIGKKMTVPLVDPELCGYRILQDGTAFGAAWADMSFVTEEIRMYYLDHWAPEGDMFYKVWYPGAHLRHCSNGAIESLGREPEMLRMYPLKDPSILGFGERIQEKDPDFLFVEGGHIRIMKIDDPEGKNALDMALFHFYRKDGAGMRVCSRFWMGLRFDEQTGKPVRTLPWYASVSAEVVRNMCLHCATEFATQARNMMLFWKDQNRG